AGTAQGQGPRVSVADGYRGAGAPDRRGAGPVDRSGQRSISVSPASGGPRCLERVHGAYAIAVLSLDEPSVLIGASRHAPLVVGVGGQGNYLASDVPALLQETRDIIRLREGELVALDGNRVALYDESGRPVHRDPSHV